jgi:ribosomal protein S18 acetylase RimI-like enzyme
MAHAEAEARVLGLPELRLYTNELMTANVAWYPRLGYRETERRAERGFARVFFEKRLN